MRETEASPWRLPAFFPAARLLLVAIVVFLPGVDPASAQQPLACGKPVTGRLRPAAIDAYRLSVPEGTVVNVEVADTGQNLGLVRLKVRDSADLETCSGTLQLRAGPATVVEVSDCIGSGDGEYSLSLSVLSEGAANCAMPLPCGTTPDGLALDVPGEVQSFTFEGRSAEQVTILSGALQQDQGEVRIRVYAPDGTPLAGADSCGASRTLQLEKGGAHTVLVSACGRPQPVRYRLAFEGPECPAGPHITYFGVSTADNHPLEPEGFDARGRPIFTRPLGQGMEIVVEGRPGAARRPAGTSAFAHDPGDPTVLPDLQMLVARPLGFGTPAVCDNTLPALGGVPATLGPAFEPTQGVANAINDLGCRVNDGAGVPRARITELDACTRAPGTADFRFVDRASTVQFCLPVARSWAFPPGDTVVRARLRDVAGFVGAEREIVVRVGGASPFKIAGLTPRNLTEAGNLLYFTANDGRSGTELWVSDGTIGGTRIAQDIAPGAPGSFPRDLVEYRNRLYFLAQDEPDRWRLFRSDTSFTGRVLDRDMGFVAPARQITRSAKRLCFFVEEGQTGLELQCTDDTPSGTARGISVGGSASLVYDVAAVGDLIFFALAPFGSSTVDLWRSDGTAPGTFVVHEFDFGESNDTRVGQFTAVDEQLFFVAGGNLSGGFALWRSDGSEAGTVPLATLTRARDGSIASNFTAVGDVLYFTAADPAHGIELWRSDGTARGTGPVADLLPGPGSSTPSALAVMDGVLYFSALDAERGRELWRSDGTARGTFVLRDVRPGPEGSDPENLVAIDGLLFFSADDGVHGREPWLSDGTEAGTVEALDLAAGSLSGSPAFFTRAGDKVMFAASDGTDFSLYGVPAPGRAVPACAGDKNGDRRVTIDELVRGVRAAEGSLLVSECPSFDTNGDGAITIDELIVAVRNSLVGCP